jgi:pimeloyl-[acyl-carrier protein] methyl ester esterase
MYFSEGASTNRIWYQDQGSGTPIVLVHGWCMSSDVWFQQLELLSESFRVISVDLPGHGRSLPFSGGFSMNICTRAIAGLISHMDLVDVILAGWSQGAQVAIQSYDLCKDQLSALVLISGTPRFIKSDDFPYGLTTTEAEGMSLKVKKNIRRALEGFTSRMFSATELIDGKQVNITHDLLSSMPLPESAVALEALQALVMTDLRDKLPLISHPTLIIHGDADVICLPGASDYMSAIIPGAIQDVFAGCGHAPFLTQPDKFNVRLLKFAAGIRGSGEK